MTLVGQRLGSLRIDRPLGEGGMGEVYLGFDEKLERRVAVKRLLDEHRLESESKARLLREARLLSKVGHPAICQIYELLEGPDADHLVLEYVDGETLRQKMRQPVAFDRAIDWSRQIADGLAAAHREQVIHRDLKPENVMVTDDGRVKILDFGVARAAEGEEGARITPLALVRPVAPGFAGDPDRTAVDPAAAGRGVSADFRTHAGTVVGTLRCMSPEQARGERLTTASDLYSFGILLQELFTGRPAYGDLPPHELWHAVRHGAAARATGIEPELAGLIDELLAHDPRRRPTAVEVIRRLDSIAAAPARRRRRRLLVTGAIAALVALTLGLVAVSWLALEARRARNVAERRQGQAEELIGFMLGDLRPKLERAGRLELLDAVGERALDYFGSVPESELSDTELVRRVEALRQLSEVRAAEGKTEDAIDVALRAVALGRAVTARAPDIGDGWLALSRAYSALASARLETGVDASVLLAELEAGLAAARTAVAAAPADERAHERLGAALSDVGVGLWNARRLDEAATRFAEAIERLSGSADALVAGSPRARDGAADLANALAWASTTEEALGRLPAATELRRRNLALQQRLLELAPDDAVAAYDLATARDFHSRLLLWQGRLDEAESEQRAAIAELSRLRALDPDNADWERAAAIARGNLGWILFEAERGDEAEREIRAALAALEALRRRDPGQRAWARMAGVSSYRLAAIAFARGDAATARRELAAALATLTALHAAEPHDAAAAQRLAEAQLLAADLEEPRAPQAARRLREGVAALLEPLAPTNGAPTLAALWVETLLGLGRAGEARATAERLRANGYAMRRFRRAVERAGL